MPASSVALNSDTESCLQVLVSDKDTDGRKERVSGSFNCYTEVTGTAGEEATEPGLVPEFEFALLKPSSLQCIALCFLPGKPLDLQFEQ